jgi:hypothetical protein
LSRSGFPMGATGKELASRSSRYSFSVFFLFPYRGAYARLKPVYIFRILWSLLAPERAEFSGQHPSGAVFCSPRAPLSLLVVNTLSRPIAVKAGDSICSVVGFLYLCTLFLTGKNESGIFGKIAGNNMAILKAVSPRALPPL